MRLAFIIMVTALMLSVAAAQDRKPNVLLICIDDLRPELNCFGKSYIRSPNLDELAARGRAFHQHFVNAPSCGPSRFTLLTGRYGPSDNGALFKRAGALNKNPTAYPASMPEWFRQHGYTTVSIGKVSHHPGGYGGKNWADTTKVEMPGAWDRQLEPCGPWQHPEGAMHGLANGEIRVKAGEMDVFQATEGGDEIYPDGIMIPEAINQLEELAKDEKPFFYAVGIIRPHLPFGAPKKYLDLYNGVQLPPIPHAEKPSGKTTWHKSGEFMKYNRWGKNPNDDAAFADDVRRHYAACVSYADALVGRLIATMKELKLDDNTIIVVWGDHGWHLGEHAIWGKHSLFEESLHSPLIIVSPKQKAPGTPTKAVVETTDIFPTLCDLTGIPKMDSHHGQSLVPQLEDPNAAVHPALGYYGKASTIRGDRYRLIAHSDGTHELYDLTDASGKNIADANAAIVAELEKALKERLEVRSSK